MKQLQLNNKIYKIPKVINKIPYLVSYELKFNPAWYDNDVIILGYNYLSKCIQNIYLGYPFVGTHLSILI